MTLDVEGVVDGGVGREKSLRGSSRFKTLHSSFALSNRQVRILCTIVAPSAGDVFFRHVKITQCSTVGWEFIGDRL